MILGAPLGRFPLGQIADLNFGILDATEEQDVAEFVGAIAALSGYLDATEAPDTAEFAGLRSEEGTLDATEAPDTAEMQGRVWAVFGAACQGKTVCVSGDRSIDPNVVASRSRDPDVVGSMRDRDTDSCRTWPRRAA
jgi:hypothetical protein